MCDKSINRKNVLRAVRQRPEDAPITGRNLRTCAVNILAVLEGHPSGTKKMEEIIVALITEGDLVHHDAVLRATIQEEKQRLREQRAAEAERRRRAHDRSIVIKGKRVERATPPTDVTTMHVVAPGAWVGFDPRNPEGLRLQSDPIPPAGGWAEDLRELRALMRDQFNDWKSQTEPVKGCCGSVDDLVDAGLDAEDVFVHPDADFEENRFALVR